MPPTSIHAAGGEGTPGSERSGLVCGGEIEKSDEEVARGGVGAGKAKACTSRGCRLCRTFHWEMQVFGVPRDRPAASLHGHLAQETQ